MIETYKIYNVDFRAIFLYNRYSEVDTRENHFLGNDMIYSWQKPQNAIETKW